MTNNGCEANPGFEGSGAQVGICPIVFVKIKSHYGTYMTKLLTFS